MMVARRSVAVGGVESRLSWGGWKGLTISEILFHLHVIRNNNNDDDDDEV